MALINCGKCRGTIDTSRSPRTGNDYQCTCGNWVRFVLPPDKIAQQEADAQTSVEVWACPACSKAHEVIWGPAGMAAEARIECSCSFEVYDGPEQVTQREWVEGPNGVKVIGLVERTMHRSHSAHRSYTVRELRQQGRLLQSSAYQPIR